jgi:hypothetical protein
VPVHIAPPGRALNFRGHDEAFRFVPADYPKIRELIGRLKVKKRRGMRLFDSDDYLDSIGHFLTTGAPNWRRHGICDSPNLYFAILPDGRFAPCCDFRLEEKLLVADPDFPKIYRSPEFRAKVKDIVRQCPGCNYGSFPEMSLSARSPATIWERFRLQMKAGFQRFPALKEDELFAIIKRITSSNPLYPRKFQHNR